MSEVLYNEVPVPGKKVYKFGDWKEYAVHDENNVKGFFGPYRFLSNFGDGALWFEGLFYPTRENAFQAAKVQLAYRERFQKLTAAESKSAWKVLPRMDASGELWDARKIDVMNRVVFEFFAYHPEYRQMLIDTGNRYLEETNHWSDVFWGVDLTKGGRNELGNLLMRVRRFYTERY